MLNGVVGSGAHEGAALSSGIGNAAAKSVGLSRHDAGHTEHVDYVPCRAREIAYKVARRAGLEEEDAQDCAMEFILRALHQLRVAPRANVDETGTPTVADEHLQAETCEENMAIPSVLRNDLPTDQRGFWIYRCAFNFALNWRRDLARRKRHEATCSDVGFNPETLALSPSSRHAVSAEDAALISLFRRDVYAACGQLPPASRAIFERFHLEGDTMAEIAFSVGKSEVAVKQSVHRQRRQVRDTLAQQGHKPL